MNSAKIKPDIVITSLDDYIKWVREETANMGKPAYRGISWGKDNIEGFKNQPACFRQTDLYDDIDKNNWVGYQKRLLKTFNNKGHNKEGLSDLELLAKIQHIENRTALLDYSFNSLIALGFAVFGNNKNGLVLINNTLNYIKIDSEQLKEENLKEENLIDKVFSENKLWVWELPRVENPRMMAQQALFIFGLDDMPYNKICLIENTKDIKKELQKIFDVHETSIYPDFAGLAKYLRIGKETAQEYFDSGHAKSTKGQYEEAIKDYDKAIELNPQLFESYNNRGVEKNILGQHEAAIEDYNEAIKLNPQDAEVYNNRGIAKAKLGKYHEAIEDFDKAIELNPQFADAYNNRGNAKAKLGQYEVAIKDYDKAIELNPQYAESYNNRGNAKSDLGQYDSAIKDFDEAIKLNPKLTEAYNNRATAKSILGRYKEAIEDSTKAIELNPQHAGAYNNRGIAKSGLGYYELAIEDFNEAIKLNPQFADAYYNRGIVKDLLADE